MLVGAHVPLEVNGQYRGPGSVHHHAAQLDNLLQQAAQPARSDGSRLPAAAPQGDLLPRALHGVPRRRRAPCPLPPQVA